MLIAGVVEPLMTVTTPLPETVETPEAGDPQVALPEASEVRTFPRAGVPLVMASPVLTVRFGTVSAPVMVSPDLLTLFVKVVKSVELK